MFLCRHTESTFRLAFPKKREILEFTSFLEVEKLPINKNFIVYSPFDFEAEAKITNKQKTSFIVLLILSTNKQ